MVEAAVSWQLLHNRDGRSLTTTVAERTKKPWPQLLKLLSDGCCNCSVSFWTCEDREVPHRALDGAKPCLRIEPLHPISGGTAAFRTVHNRLKRVRCVVGAIWTDESLRPCSVA